MSPAPPQRSRVRRTLRAPWVTPSAIVVAGLLLRIYHLDSQSLWYDEATSLTASRLPLGAMRERIVAFSPNHPPLHYFVLHLWLKWIGFGPFQARLLSVLFGTLAIALMYVLARYLFGRRTALLAASLLAVSQLAVMYAQEARPYAQLLFLVLCSVHLFLVALWERRAAAWWGFVGAATLMIYTHYYGVLVLASLFLYAVWSPHRRTLRLSWLIPAAAVTVAPGALWLESSGVWQGLRSKLGGPQPPWFAVYWWTPLATVNDFNGGRFAGLHVPPPLWALVAGGLLFCLPALVGLQPLLTRPPADSPAGVARERVKLLAILFLLPLLIVLGIGVLGIQYDARYVLFCIVPYYMLVARGISALRTPALRRLLTVLLLAYSVCALRANYFLPYKENYRDALAYLAREYREADCCVFLPFERLPLEWAIYHDDQPRLSVATLEGVASGRTRCDRVWLITYRRVEWAIRRDEDGARQLEATHARVEQKEFFWVNVGLYARRGSPPLAHGG